MLGMEKNQKWVLFVELNKHLGWWKRFALYIQRLCPCLCQVHSIAHWVLWEEPNWKKDIAGDPSWQEFILPRRKNVRLKDFESINEESACLFRRRNHLWGDRCNYEPERDDEGETTAIHSSHNSNYQREEMHRNAQRNQVFFHKMTLSVKTIKKTKSSWFRTGSTKFRSFYNLF